MKQYPVDGATANLVEQIFKSVPLSQDQQQRIEEMGKSFHQLAGKIARYTPPGDEQRKCLEYLRQSMLMSTEAIRKAE